MLTAQCDGNIFFNDSKTTRFLKTWYNSTKALKVNEYLNIFIECFAVAPKFSARYKNFLSINPYLKL